MKTLTLLMGTLALALARPGNLIVSPVLPQTIVNAVPSSLSAQFHAQDVAGQYSFGYTNPLSAKTEVKTADGITRGGYSFVDAEGKLQSVQYTADPVNGFRVAATILPVAPIPQQVSALQAPVQVEETPEVAEAKAKHLAAVEQAKKLVETVNASEQQGEETKPEEKAKLDIPQTLISSTILTGPSLALRTTLIPGLIPATSLLTAPISAISVQSNSVIQGTEQIQTKNAETEGPQNEQKNETLTNEPLKALELPAGVSITTLPVAPVIPFLQLKDTASEEKKENEMNKENEMLPEAKKTDSLEVKTLASPLIQTYSLTGVSPIIPQPLLSSYLSQPLISTYIHPGFSTQFINNFPVDIINPESVKEKSAQNSEANAQS